MTQSVFPGGTQNLMPPFTPGWRAGAREFVTQNLWQVDATVGNDSAPGTPGAPLRTLAELSRRLHGTVIAPTVTTFDIELVGSFSLQDLVLEQYMPGQGTWTVRGRMTNIPVGGAQLVSVYTAEVAGASWAQLESVGANFTGLEGKRIRFTSGPANGQVCYIAAVVAPTIVLVTTSVSETASSANPAVGNSFVVETWGTTIHAPHVNVIGGPSFNPPTTLVRVRDLQCANDGRAIRNGYVLSNGNRTTAYFYGCRTDGNGPGLSFCYGLTRVGCVHENGTMSLNQGDFFDIRCLNRRQLNVSNMAYYQGSGANYHHGGGVSAATLTVGNGAQWEDIGPRVFTDCANTASGLIQLSDGGQGHLSVAGALVWGANPLQVASPAWNIQSRCGVEYVTKPTVADGFATDVKLGAAFFAYAAIPAVDAASQACMVVRS